MFACSSCPQLRAAGKEVPKSVANGPITLRAYGVRLVQDALELAPEFPDHPVHLVSRLGWREVVGYSFSGTAATCVQPFSLYYGGGLFCSLSFLNHFS